MGYGKWHSCENEHGVEASASMSSLSYETSESGVRVDGESDGPTDKNTPDMNDGTNGWNVRGSGACRRTHCDQTEGDDWELLDPPLELDERK